MKIIYQFFIALVCDTRLDGEEIFTCCWNHLWGLFELQLIWFLPLSKHWDIFLTRKLECKDNLVRNEPFKAKVS